MRSQRALLTLAAAAALAVVLLPTAGCLFGPPPAVAKANAAKAGKALDDFIYCDVELLLAPGVVMRSASATASLDASQATAMKTWLAKDLAVIEASAKTLDDLGSNATGDAAIEEMLAATRTWLDHAYLPAVRKAVAEVVVGAEAKSVQEALDEPWSGPAGEQVKARIAALRAALAKKAAQ